MERPLAGRLILVAEDEPLIALDIKQTFEVLMACSLDEALSVVDEPDLCAAVLDHVFKEGDSSEVCARLKKRNIPFVNYSGYDRLGAPCQAGVLVQKPAPILNLIATLKSLLTPAQVAHE